MIFWYFLRVALQLILEDSFRYVYFIASQKVYGLTNLKYFFDSFVEVFP